MKTVKIPIFDEKGTDWNPKKWNLIDNFSSIIETIIVKYE